MVVREDRKYTPTNKALSRIVKLLLNLDRIDPLTLNLNFAEGLGLYSSWARGTNHYESDLDVWVKVNSLPSESELAKMQSDLGRRAGTEVNLLVLTPEKLHRLKEEAPPILPLLDNEFGDFGR